MSESNDLEGSEGEAGGGGDRRDLDRRGGDRRRDNRRTPAPLWRRPWAFVAYGVAGALVLVLVLRVAGDDESREPIEVETTSPIPVAGPGSAPAATAPVQDGYTTGDYERLLSEGAEAVGQRVRMVSYCTGTRMISLSDVDQVHPAIAGVSDSQARVPAAECKWGDSPTAPDFLLLIPSEFAERFAAMPSVEQGFITRRRVPVVVEWLGRPEALALRPAAVLRQMGG